MKKDDAYELLICEYLSKCKEYGCDSCMAEFYCIKNGLKHSREPENDCVEKLKAYLKQH